MHISAEKVGDFLFLKTTTLLTIPLMYAIIYKIKQEQTWKFGKLCY